MTYISERFFKLWHYSTSHNTLIIRSEKQYEDVEYLKTYNEASYTIDIEFTGVQYMSLIDNFKGITLTKSNDHSLVSLTNLKNTLHESKLYIINSENQSFYVLAETCIIGKSKWGADIDRITDFELEYEDQIEVGNGTEW